MLKTSLLVLAGLVAGFTIAFWMQPSSPPTVAAPLPEARTGADRAAGTEPAQSTARVAALEGALAAEVEQRVALEARVEELAAQLDALGERAVAAAAPRSFPAGGPDPAAVAEMRARVRGDPVARNELAERRFVERLVAEGFAADRAEWIVRRTEELRMEALQAQYDAQRGGRPVEPSGSTLRAELGDADYERYLKADGRPTTIPVRDVLASSPAERSGLKAGDEILAYNGERVFDMRELNELTLKGVPLESVVVDVRRDGQNVQLVLPRGPLGITGGGLRGR